MRERDPKTFQVVLFGLVLAALVATSLPVLFVSFVHISYKSAEELSTKEQIDEAIHLFTSREVSTSETRWAGNIAMEEIMLPTPEARLFEYCLIYTCFHASYDADGRVLAIIDSYDL